MVVLFMVILDQWVTDLNSCLVVDHQVLDRMLFIPTTARQNQSHSRLSQTATSSSARTRPLT